MEEFERLYQVSYEDMCSLYEQYYQQLVEKGWELKELYLDEQSRTISLE